MAPQFPVCAPAPARDLLVLIKEDKEKRRRSDHRHAFGNKHCQWPGDPVSHRLIAVLCGHICRLLGSSLFHVANLKL